LKKHGLNLTDELQHIEGICIYPKEYFCPKNYITLKLQITKNTYSIHHFDSSWHTEEADFIMDLKRKLIRLHLGKVGGYAVCRDCKLDARLMNAARAKIVTLAVNTYLGFDLQEISRTYLLKEIDKNLTYFIKNMFEYVSMEHFKRHIKTFIRIILLKHGITEN